MKIGVIVGDVQGDFTELKNGSLAVKGTDQNFINAVRENTKLLKQAGFPIFATQDWHPREHISFYTNHEGKRPFDVITIQGKEQVLWPPHCIQNTDGAKILLDRTLFDAVVQKGTEVAFDSYSAFKDDGGSPTQLHDLLQAQGIRQLIVYGIATDYCVKATVLDAVQLGYKVIVIKSLIRGVDPETSRRALEEIERLGVMVLDKLDLGEIKRLVSV